MSNYLRLALEGDATEVAEGGVEDGVEYDISRVSQDMDAEFEDEQSMSVVMENLAGYALCIESLIQNNACSEGTLTALRLGVEQQLNRIHAPINAVSLESEGVDIVRQHEIALEGIRDILNKYYQANVLGVKHRLNAVADFFRSTHSQIGKYRNKLSDAESEFRTESGSWENVQHEGSLLELWYHFSNDRGQTKDISSAIAKDVALSTYILKTYSGEVIGAVAKLGAIIRAGKLRTLKDAEKFFQDVERLKTGAQLFNQSYIGGHPYLSVTGLTVKRGDRRRVNEIGGKARSRLAELATPDTVVEVGKWTHTAMKVAANGTGYVGMIANFVASAKIKMTTNEIGDAIKAGFTYLDNVDSYITNGRRFLIEAAKASEALVRLVDTIDNEMPSEDAAAVRAGVKQVEQYLNNLVHCYQNPAKAEVARSIKGAKYNMYLALRMIFNAK